MKGAPVILIAPSTQRRGSEFFDYSLSLSDAYPQAITAANGVPWILSCSPEPSLIAECVRCCDGVMLTGGDDVNPGLYTTNLSPQLKKTVSPADHARDLAELLLIQETFRQRKPLLAICRGQQLLNVAFGGTLIVDIGMQKTGATNHSRSDLKDRIVHEIDLAPESLVAKIFGKRRLGVNSSHHQAIDDLASLFRVTAVSPDGIVEAIELQPAQRSRLPFLLAVQFHPERLIKRHPEFLRLFERFTQACRACRLGSKKTV